MNTPIDFSAYVMHNLKIDNLTQQLLVGPAFDLLKGTCKSRVELEYHFEECYKAVNDQLDCTNPEVPAQYFINDDLEYLKGGSLSRKYTTSTTKTKAAKYDNIKGIEDMVMTLWSLGKVAYDRYALWGISIIAITHVKVLKWYNYGYLKEIKVRREDHNLHKFKEGDFPNLNPRDIEDMMLLLVQKKVSNLERDVIFDLNVALWMFTRRVVIQKRVGDLQLGVKSYQKKLNITRLQTLRTLTSPT
ncbi:hypothetical protein Tco_0918598 [Tanacetum coccineum]